MVFVFDGRKSIDPRRAINYLDSCAFNPKEVEREAANKIIELGRSGQIHVAIPKSVADELDNSSTPPGVRDLASGMFWVFAPSLTPAEQRKKEQVCNILRGNAKAGKHDADACHVFEVGRRFGYFITVDDRIDKKRDDLNKACGVIVLRPNEWLDIFQQTEPG